MRNSTRERKHTKEPNFAAEEYNDFTEEFFIPYGPSKPGWSKQKKE